MYEISNKLIRIRYLLEKKKRKAEKVKFTYNDMARMFDVSNRTVLTWVARSEVTKHLPVSVSRKKKVLKWLNDGTISDFLKSREGKDQEK